MSISPRKKDEEGFSAVHRFQNIMVAASSEYKKDPASFLFYAMLTATVVGLFFSMSFPFSYYFILGVLAITELYRKWNI